MALSRGLAVVTGSSSGIGRETARAFAVRGYRTALVARRAELLETLAAELVHHAPSVAVPLDLSCEKDVAVGMSRIQERIGPVDVLVNCAGFGMYAPFLDSTPDDHDQLMRVHYFGAVAAMRAVLPSMLERGRGHIINVGSMSAKMGPWGHGAYAAAKAALTALTESLSAEYGPSGVHFSVVHPGIVDTPYFQRAALATLRERTQRWLIRPERVARAVTGLVERPRLQVCVPRHYRAVDVIRAVSPHLLHRLVARQSAPRGWHRPSPSPEGHPFPERSPAPEGHPLPDPEPFPERTPDPERHPSPGHPSPGHPFPEGRPFPERSPAPDLDPDPRPSPGTLPD